MKLLFLFIILILTLGILPFTVGVVRKELTEFSKELWIKLLKKSLIAIIVLSIFLIGFVIHQNLEEKAQEKEKFARYAAEVEVRKKECLQQIESGQYESLHLVWDSVVNICVPSSPPTKPEIEITNEDVVREPVIEEETAESISREEPFEHLRASIAETVGELNEEDWHQLTANEKRSFINEWIFNLENRGGSVSVGAKWIVALIDNNLRKEPLVGEGGVIEHELVGQIMLNLGLEEIVTLPSS